MSGIALGDVLKVQFPAQRPPGHERTGNRPAVLVGPPDPVGAPRFPALVVVPLAPNVGDATPSPVLGTDQSGLTVPGVAVMDNVWTPGDSHITGRLGTLSPDEDAPVQSALIAMFRL